MTEDTNQGHEPRAWLIRGGSHGERETQALTEGLAIVGWEEMGDLKAYSTWPELISALQLAYPEVGRAVIGNWAGQLWKFDTDIQAGDHIVMPLKTSPGRVAIGRVSGPYEYRVEKPAELRHVRKVDWIRRDIAWESIRPDLRASLGSLLTVCGLVRHDAARRIAHLAEDGVDPGYAGEAEVTSASELLDDAASREAGALRTLTIRNLLEHWGAERRTAAAVSTIKSDLAGKGLTTRPPFTEGDLSAVVALVPLGTEPDAESTLGYGTTEVEDVSEPEPMSRRLGSLPARLVGISSEVGLTYAKTLMVQRGFSQLAVIDADGTYHGAVTWESIGRAHMAFENPSLSNAVVRAPVVDHDALLLDQVSVIYDNGFVFVRDADRVHVTGILTASDLTAQFGTLARPFVLIEEAENRLRCAVDIFGIEELRPALPGNMRRRVNGPVDLTFGSYKHIFADPDRWAKLGWNLDQGQFLDLLETVRKIRNELMHFAPDPLSDEKFAAVNGLLQLLRTAAPNL
ncbi:hypothetical protein KHQ06_16880 [Nocardia tengchongensis]|uniref:CBS domain-containing protein n=1 Tax=Nocardia tengchongensis TaxID=2055889 RepID=A0ABX8CWM0_9NOCA|nr:hypothetical protein [Nocardia tengchongensis]QVI24291.1 hypothetical protein KHQ06_16880 [Nocardia tengchongensis]